VRRQVGAAVALCLVAMVLAACGGQGGQGSQDQPERELVWSDDFDGANGALPDATKWKLETFADPTDDEKQCYTDRPDNVHTDGGGYLVIAALEEAGNCADGWYRFVTSARLTTQGLHSWKYGRFEIRAKMPTGEGTWPAFWSMGDDPGVEWPEVGEIDAMEFGGSDPTHLIGTVHGADDAGERWFLQGSTDADAPLSDDMHTYAVDWNADRVVWYLDGEEYARVTRDEAEERGNWAFDRPFYLILNLAMGGYIGGEVPVDLPYPQELVVDWVRVYQ
jgi:beta-glucanase (GH16 family)